MTPAETVAVVVSAVPFGNRRSTRYTAAFELLMVATPAAVAAALHVVRLGGAVHTGVVRMTNGAPRDSASASTSAADSSRFQPRM